MTKADLEAAGCSERSCWVKDELTDAGVSAILGSGWSCLLLDQHFSGLHRCLSQKGRKGGMCDGVAVHRQQSRVRLLEVKKGPRARDARPQLKKGAEWTLRIPGARAADLVAECHMRAAPRSSYRPRPIDVATTRGRKARIPFSIWADGERIV